MIASVKRIGAGWWRSSSKGNFAHDARVTSTSGSVASESHGTDALHRGDLSGGLATAYLAGCLAVSLGVAAIAACSSQAGAVGAVTVRPPTDTVSVAPARIEQAPGAGQKVAAGEGLGPRPAGERIVAAILPAATDYTGTERVVPAQLWTSIVAHFPESERMTALRIALCESRYKADAVSSDGARGIFQVMPVHGAIPADVDGQVAQAARIQREQGWSPWECH